MVEAVDGRLDRVEGFSGGTNRGDSRESELLGVGLLSCLRWPLSLSEYFRGILGLLVGRSPPGFLDDWWREDVESTITEGAEPRRGMEVWMGDFMRVADVGLEPGGVVSESEDFCAVWAGWFRGNVNRFLYSSTLSGDKDTIIFGPG
jgi:hypothetical protein